jgi:hypothetical protein
MHAYADWQLSPLHLELLQDLKAAWAEHLPAAFDTIPGAKVLVYPFNVSYPTYPVQAVEELRNTIILTTGLDSDEFNLTMAEAHSIQLPHNNKAHSSTLSPTSWTLP